ncbi:MAG: VOC family protein, partial [Cyanobacteria bacterium J06631_2]
MIKLAQVLLSILTSTILFAPQQFSLAQTEQNRPNSIYPLVQNEADEELMDLVREVEMVGITVRDMERAIAFYTDALSFRKISDVEVHGEEYEKLLGLLGVRLRLVQMQLGSEKIELIQHLTSQGQPISLNSSRKDLWFQHIAIAVTDMSQADQKLREHGITKVSSASPKLPEYIEAAGSETFYFRDPDGNTLELIHYPSDQGNSRWQNSTQQVFMGIDHTAIAISNTEASRQFYQNILGLEVAGESEYDLEQENLSNVQDPQLKTTGLKAKHGIGIEFIEYLQPQNVQPIPIDTSPQDMTHWETTLVVEDTNMVAEKLLIDGHQFVSEALVNITEPKLGFSRGFMVRD